MLSGKQKQLSHSALTTPVYAKSRLKPEKDGGLVALVSAMLLATSFVSFFYFGNKIIQELCLLAFVIPAWMQARQGNVNKNLATKAFLTAVPFLFAETIAYIISIDDQDDPLFEAVVLANMAFSFFVFAVLGSHPRRDVWRDIMVRLSPFIAPVFLFVFASQRHAYNLGRWQPYYTGDAAGAHPNWWGLMALGLSWCALMWRNIVPRFAGLMIAAVFMFLVQSRGALVASFVAFVLCSGYFIPLTGKKIGLMFLALLLLSPALILGGDQGVDFIANHVLLMNDPDRGAGSGMSGRTVAYAQAWEAVINNPIFGSGTGAFKFVHNGFLMILAESGVFGLAATLYLFSASLYRYAKARHWQGVGLILSYIVLLMTYPRLFNNNMTSLLAVMVIMRGLCLAPVKPTTTLMSLPQKSAT